MNQPSSPSLPPVFLARLTSSRERAGRLINHIALSACSTLFARSFARPLQVVEVAESELGGCKLASAAISGRSAVYGHLKFESGIHRVQRVPVTESGVLHMLCCAWPVGSQPWFSMSCSVSPSPNQVRCGCCAELGCSVGAGYGTHRHPTMLFLSRQHACACSARLRCHLTTTVPVLLWRRRPHAHQHCLGGSAAPG